MREGNPKLAEYFFFNNAWQASHIEVTGFESEKGKLLEKKSNKATLLRAMSHSMRWRFGGLWKKLSASLCYERAIAAKVQGGLKSIFGAQRAALISAQAMPLAVYTV